MLTYGFGCLGALLATRVQSHQAWEGNLISLRTYLHSPSIRRTYYIFI